MKRRIEVTFNTYTTVKLNTHEDYELNSLLVEYFSYPAENRFFIPSVKAKRWDGIFRLYSSVSGVLSLGLLGELKQFAHLHNVKLNIDPSIMRTIPIFDREKMGEREQDFIDDLRLSSRGQRITPRDHQMNIFRSAYSWPQMVFESATASGKSLSIYMLTRLYYENLLLNQDPGCLNKNGDIEEIIENDFSVEDKILIIVPTLGLLHQLYKDFEDYAQLDKSFDVENYVDKITGSVPDISLHEITAKPIIISNWQSIAKKGKMFFSTIRGLIVDECHQAKAQSIKGIREKCANTIFTYGFTGSLQDGKCHRYLIQQLLGPAKVIATSKDLVEEKILSPVNVKISILTYTKEEMKNFTSFVPERSEGEVELRKRIAELEVQDELSSSDSSKLSKLLTKLEHYEKIYAFKKEKEFTYQNKFRNNFIVSLATKQKENTLILFDKVAKHGQILYNMIAEKLLKNDRKCFFVCKDVEGEERYDITQIVENERGAVIVASFGTFSTGVNIKNLHNIIMVDSTKSKIRVLQSFGRGMRLNKNKKGVTIYDIVDDLRPRESSKNNYALKHLEERQQLYKNQGYEYEISTFELGN